MGRLNIRSVARMPNRVPFPPTLRDICGVSVWKSLTKEAHAIKGPFFLYRSIRRRELPLISAACFYFCSLRVRVVL